MKLEPPTRPKAETYRPPSDVAADYRIDIKPAIARSGHRGYRWRAMVCGMPLMSERIYASREGARKAAVNWIGRYFDAKRQD